MSETAGNLFRLHVGGRQALPGWTVFDIAVGPHVDVVGDCRDLSAFAAGSAADIYASHVLEHLGYLDDLPRALAEFHRVLAPGGRLLVSVPDLDALCRLFLDPALDIQERFHVMRMMFGGQTDPHDLHRAGLNEAFLRDYLAVAGFRAVRRVEAFGLCQDSSTIRVRGVPISLNMVAEK